MNVQIPNIWFLAKSKVTTLNGHKNIESVKIGDHLLSTTGTFRKIMQLHQIMYTGKIFNINIVGYGIPISCINTQSFYVREKKATWDSEKNEYTQYKYESPSWKNADELTIYSHIGIVVNQDAIISQFMVGSTDISYYLYIIGFLVGAKNYKLEKIRLTNGKYEYHILIIIPKTGVENEIIKRIQRLMTISIVCCETAISKTIMCHDAIWYEMLKTFGNPGKKQMIPEWVQQSPIQHIQHFIRGYTQGYTQSTNLHYRTLHICTSKTPTLSAILSDKGNSYHALEKCEGVKTTTNEPQMWIVESYAIALGLQRLFMKLGQIIYIKSYQQPKHTFYMCEIKSTNKICIEDGYAWFPIANISKNDSMNTLVYNIELQS